MQMVLALSNLSSVGKESACNVRDPSLIPGLGGSAGKGVGHPFQHSWASLVAQLVKNLPTIQETWVQSRVGKIPWRRERLPTPVFLLGKPHIKRSQVGYSPWDQCRETDMTEHAVTHLIN